MKLNSNTQSLEGKTNRAWKGIVKGVSTLMIPIWLGITSPVMLSKSVNANTHPNPAPVACTYHGNDQKTPWEHIKSLFKKKKKDYTINTLKVQIGHSKFFDVKEGQTIKVPYDKDFYVLPQKKHKLTTENLIKRLDGRNVKDKYGRKLVTRGRINPEDYCIKEGERVKVFVTYETPTELFGSTYFYATQGHKPKEPKYRKHRKSKKPKEITKKIIVEHRHVYDHPPKEKPVPGEKEEEKKVKKVKVRKEKKKKEKKPSIPSALIKLGYGFEGETFTDKREDVDPERTGQGLIAQGTYAGKNYEGRISLLSFRYDDPILIPGMGVNMLREKWTEFEAEIKGKAGPFVLALNYKHMNDEWKPLFGRPHFMLHEMEKYTSNVVAGGGGFALGRFDKSFIEVLGYYGIGKLNEKVNVPGREIYFPDINISSQTITEWFGKAHAKLYLGKLLVELIGTYGEYKGHDLNGKRITYGGSVGFPLGIVSRNLNNVRIGGFYHRSEIDDSNVKLDTDVYGIMLMLNLPTRK